MNTVSECLAIQSTMCIIKFGPRFIWTSVARPDPIFWVERNFRPKIWVEPNFEPKIWVESGLVGPQGKKIGPIGSG